MVEGEFAAPAQSLSLESENTKVGERISRASLSTCRRASIPPTRSSRLDSLGRQFVYIIFAHLLLRIAGASGVVETRRFITILQCRLRHVFEQGPYRLCKDHGPGDHKVMLLFLWWLLATYPGHTVFQFSVESSGREPRTIWTELQCLCGYGWTAVFIFPGS